MPLVITEFSAVTGLYIWIHLEGILFHTLVLTLLYYLVLTVKL